MLWVRHVQFLPECRFHISRCVSSLKQASKSGVLVEFGGARWNISHIRSLISEVGKLKCALNQAKGLQTGRGGSLGLFVILLFEGPFHQIKQISTISSFYIWNMCVSPPVIPSFCFLASSCFRGASWKSCTLTYGNVTSHMFERPKESCPAISKKTFYSEVKHVEILQYNEIYTFTSYLCWFFFCQREDGPGVWLCLRQNWHGNYVLSGMWMWTLY